MSARPEVRRLGAVVAGAVAVWGWAALNGLPRLNSMLWSGPTGQLSLHPVVALVTWVALTAALGWGASRALRPRGDVEHAPGVVQRIAASPTGALGLFGVVVLVLATLLTPMLTSVDPIAQVAVWEKLGPGWHVHPETGEDFVLVLGADRTGRDVLARLLYSGRVSLTIGGLAVGLAATLGTLVGSLAGYFGGRVDWALMRSVDLLLSMPRLVLLLAIVGLFRSGDSQILLMVLVFGLTGWMGVARIVRSEVQSLRERPFVQAARVLGLPVHQILLRHVVPNAIAPVIVQATLAIGGTILAEAALSFLGFGIPDPWPAWGKMVASGRSDLLHSPWVASCPALALVWAVMSFNLLGDGLRDALDPKLRES